MNNSTRNLKMKKLLIASTALVATAGMASADITISGHAAAGIYSGLDYTAAVAAKVGAITAAEVTALNTAHTAAVTKAANGAADLAADTATTASEIAALLAHRNGSGEDSTSGKVDTGLAGEIAALEVTIANTTAALGAPVANDVSSLATKNAELAAIDGIIAAATGTAAASESRSGDGVYSNAGVDFTMTGATDNGITFSATVNIDAGTEVDTGDFELDGADGGTAGLGAVSMTGTFGTLTFDDGGIDNLYDDGLAAADLSYSTTIGAVSLTVASDVTAKSANANSFSAGYSASGMAFTLTGSETAAGTSTSLAMSYALNDTVSISADTDQAAGAESVQTIGATTTLNGVSVSVSSANNSTWDVDLGYTAGGFALTYGVDETDHWTATATSALGGGATFAAGVSSDNEMYAGVSFAF
jgi:outer membrane protein OmpU